MSKGIGGHHRAFEGLKDEWLTPPEIVKALGPFDLDPCSPINRPWPTANNHFTIEDDGLSKSWAGSVWLNPPYGPHTLKWMEKLAKHGDGIALIFARTETEIFFQAVWGKATAILFIYGRLHFYDVEGKRASNNSGAPSVLIAYGHESAKRLKNSGIQGFYVDLSHGLFTTSDEIMFKGQL
jgi:hypothetical protein